MKNQKTRFQRLFDNLNWNAVTGAVVGGSAFLGLIALLIWVLVSMSSCQKETSFAIREPRIIENDSHLMPAEGWNSTNRPAGYGGEANKGKGKGRGKPDKPVDTTGGEPQDTTYNPPTVSGGVILLDFDGQTVAGTSWNVNGPIYCQPANQTAEEQAQIVARVQEDYSPFAVTVTADSTLYHAAPANKRMRVVITESWEWYGQAGGVAYIGSFTWGDNTPCFVFSSLLGYNGKYIADAASHEASHTLGNRHQGKCDGTQYNPDIAPDGKGYLMGYPYDKISGWQVGVTPQCMTQDDRAIILSTLSK